jgi:polysaccharide biosynthesis transport protein
MMKTLPDPAVGLDPVAVEPELSLKDIVAILSRRRLFIVATTLLIVVLAALLCLVMTRRYEAAAQIQVQKGASDSLGLEGASGAANGEADALTTNLTLETQVGILQSDALALKVIKDLHLEDTADFKQHWNPISWAMDLFTPGGASDPPGASLEASPRRRERLLKTFSKRLEVKIEPGTRIINIHYQDRDPVLAANVVNHLIESLNDYSFQTRFAATAQASKWLEGQVGDLRKDSEDLQAKFVKLQKESGILALGDVDANGHLQTYSAALEQFQQATTALTQAKTNRILKGAVYEVVKTGDPESISGISANPALAGAAAGMNNQFVLIQNLRTQEASLRGQIDAVSAKFGPAYPKLDELKGNLGAIQSAIHEEVERMRERAKNEYAVAKQVEDSAERDYDTTKQQADSVNDKAVEYAIVRQEAEQSRNLYEKLLGKLREAGALEGFRSTNISVVSAALPPYKPARPNAPLYLGAALGGGLFLSCLLAFVVDLLDGKIEDIKSLESLVGHTALGILPSYTLQGRRFGLLKGASYDRHNVLPAIDEPHSPYVEALRALRTSLLSSRNGAPQTVLITSSTEGEGKTTLATNLAIVLAQLGRRVLLVDADIRRPHVHDLLNLSSDIGLSSLLSHKVDEQELANAIVRLEQAPGLDILLAGPVPLYSAELLGSQEMKQALKLWRSQYDYVILDGAPVLPVTDSVILSSNVDATLLVARYEYTERQSVDRSLRLLRSQAGPHSQLGVVLNAVERTASWYQGYFGYKDSAYMANRLGGSVENS